MSTPFVIERTLNAPVQKVWKALTDKNEMKIWYFDLKDFKPEVGFKFEFDGGKEGRTYRHLCEVIEAIPDQKLTYSWRYDGYPGNSVVTFELFPERNKTRLKLTHAGLETFPAIEDFDRGNFAMGWTSLIGTHLPDYLEGALQVNN